MMHRGFGEKIFEVFQHLAMNNITLIKPNYIKQYVKTNKMDKLYDVFRNLDNETQLILLSTTMPNKVLGVTFKFKMDPVNTIEGLHNLAIPDQIHEETIKDEEDDKVFVQDSPAGWSEETHCGQSR